jgi:hypothetical protein
MSDESGFGSGITSRRLLEKGAAGLSLALLFLGGTVHATPITSLDDAQLRNSKELTNRASAPGVTTEQLGSAKSRSALALPAGTLLPPSSSSACIFSSGCAKTVEVPEPTSLVLVGTGLLSMAGLIRRRLSR